MPHYSLQAAAEYITTIGNSAFWVQLKAAPGQTAAYLLDHPVVMMVIVIGAMLVANLAKHRPR